VFRVLAETASRCGNNAALHEPVRHKKERSYRTYSWNDWLTHSREIALGLHALGLQKGEIVCILSETRAEFYLVDLGIMAAGGVSAALYTAYPMPELAENIRSIQPRFFFVEDATTLANFAEAAARIGVRIPEHVVLLSGQAEGAITLEMLEQLGREAADQDATLFERMQDALTPADPAILYLTSGATGTPKMGLTSHAAIVANIDMAPGVLPIGPEDSTLAFLPSAHMAQRIVLEFVPLRMGTPVWFSEGLARLPSELRATRPTIFLAPPRLWERMYATILTEVKKRPAIARNLFFRSLALGKKASALRESGQQPPLWMKAALRVADRLVFSKVRERLGGRMSIAASGAAPLGKQLAEFFAGIGLRLLEGYGLTETGVLCLTPLHKPRAGSIGKPLPGVELRLTEEGELQARTPCMFMGYYRDDAATASVLSRDGWFSTGDLAQVDADGYWYITGRKKELIVSSNGKKIYPARIEALFKMEPLIGHVLLIGDDRPYVTAIFAVNATEATKTNGSARALESAVKDAVARVNDQLADFERIRRFKVLDREFSIEHGELTPTMKLRRSRAIENHRALVTELYLGKEE